MANQHSTPRADVLAEEYKGTYLWAELDKARARIADLEEQFDTACAAIRELHEELWTVRDGDGPEYISSEGLKYLRGWFTRTDGFASNPAWKYGDSIKATMTVSNPANKLEIDPFPDGDPPLSNPAKGHPMLGVSEMHTDAHSPASEPCAWCGSSRHDTEYHASGGESIAKDSDPASEPKTFRITPGQEKTLNRSARECQ